MYHLHIPFPDPMTNPSTETRAEFYQVKGTPSYAIDGKMDMGGGARDEAITVYDKLNPKVEERLKIPAEARLNLAAFLQGEVVRVKVSVDQITGGGADLKLHVALVEEGLSYSGEGGLRFHPMVVRNLGGDKAGGFALSGSGVTNVEHEFNLSRISLETKKDLEDTEKDQKMTFRKRMYDIRKDQLNVAAFVQNAKTRKVLQAAFVRVQPVP